MSCDGVTVTQNILNPPAVKLSGRIEHLGWAAGWLESAETKSLQEQVQDQEPARAEFQVFLSHLIGIAREGHWLTKLNRLAYVAGH